jgi:hypothetical protein
MALDLRDDVFEIMIDEDSICPLCCDCSSGGYPAGSTASEGSDP